MRLCYCKKNLSPLILRQRRQHLGGDYFFFLAAGFLAAGFLTAFFFVAIGFYFLVYRAPAFLVSPKVLASCWQRRNL
jgi:hypothetical protein